MHSLEHAQSHIQVKWLILVLYEFAFLSNVLSSIVILRKLQETSTAPSGSRTNAKRTARPLQNIKGNPKYLGAFLAQGHAHLSSVYDIMAGLGKP